MNVSQIKQVSATGDVTTVDSHLRSVSLTAGSDTATLTVRAGGSGGTTVLTVKALAATTATVPDLGGAFCGEGVHATLAGTAPVATFVWV